MSIHISEFNVYGAVAGGDFVEVVAPTGTDLSGYEFYVYNADGTVGAGPFSLGTPVDTDHGLDIYVIDSSALGFSMSNSSGLVLVDDGGGVVQFLSEQDDSITATNGPATGMTSTQTSYWPAGHSVQTDDGGVTYFPQASPNKGAILCFAAGTVIATPSGEKRIEVLNDQDTIIDAEGRPRRIVLRSKSRIDLQNAPRDLLPVLIRAHALGPGRPAYDLIVSGNHRILVGGKGQLEGLFSTPVLVPAKALLDLPGVRLMHGRKHMTWHHLACASHRLVLANGCASETMLLGPMAINGLPRRAHYALRHLSFAKTRCTTALNGPACAPSLSVQACRRILAAARRRQPELMDVTSA